MQFEKTRPSAKLPTRAHANDAGLDLYSANYVKVPGLIGTLQDILNDIVSELPGNLGYIEDKIKDLSKCFQLVGTGIRNELPEGHVGLIWDKSGLGSKGITVLGGVVDEGYRGEIKVIVMNLGLIDFEIKNGTKIAQYLVQPINYVDVGVVQESNRLDSGFGSTGE